MDAIVTAGGIPEPGTPLFVETQGGPKALLDIHGKPMIQWVIDALCGAPSIERIIVVGLSADCGLECSKIVDYLPNQGGLLQNMRAGMKRAVEVNPAGKHVLSVSSDIPGITSEMVEWVIAQTITGEYDFYYNIITRQVMEARFPDSKRTYTRTKDMELCGGDMNVINPRIGTEKDDLWEGLLASRKNVIKQASIIGFGTLFRLLLRQISIQETVHTVSKRLNIRGQAVICPYAEIGMDVDKPFQLEIMRRYLAQANQAPRLQSNHAG